MTRTRYLPIPVLTCRNGTHSCAVGDSVERPCAAKKRPKWPGNYVSSIVGQLEDARRQVPDATDGQAVAVRATALLSAYPRDEIVATGPVLRKLLAESYRSPLWAAAYMINGGCSDDGFDYFRGWLIVQGHEVFERIIADPDALADLPIIRAERLGGARLECEDTLYIASRAHRKATGDDYPDCVFTIRYPELDPGWNFDFSDQAEMKRRLPRLAALCVD